MHSKLYYLSSVRDASFHIQVPATWDISHLWKMLSGAPSIGYYRKLLLINHTQVALPLEMDSVRSKGWKMEQQLHGLATKSKWDSLRWENRGLSF